MNFEETRAYQAAYRQKNRARLTELVREWNRRNPDAAKAAYRRYYRSAKGKATRRARLARTRSERLKKMRQYNRAQSVSKNERPSGVPEHQMSTNRGTCDGDGSDGSGKS